MSEPSYKHARAAAWPRARARGAYRALPISPARYAGIDERGIRSGCMFGGGPFGCMFGGGPFGNFSRSIAI